MKATATSLTLIISLAGHAMAMKDWWCAHKFWSDAEPMACYDQDNKCTLGVDCGIFIRWQGCFCPDSTTYVNCKQSCPAPGYK